MAVKRLKSISFSVPNTISKWDTKIISKEEEKIIFLSMISRR